MKKFKHNINFYKINEDYKEEINKEFKNNSITLSFALSIIVIGILSVFYNNSNSLLIGISISSLLLTLIQCFSNGNTILNILPIFTLLIFGFFQKSIENIPIINILLKERYSNLIIFISFSLTFLTQAYKNIIYNYKLKKMELNYNLEKNKMIKTDLNIINKVKDKAFNIKKISEEKGLYDLSFNKAINELVDYVDNETFISSVKSSLIEIGNDNCKSVFSIEEVESSIISNSTISKNNNFNSYRDYDDEEE
jgi:hypothetical protein